MYKLPNEKERRKRNEEKWVAEFGAGFIFLAAWGGPGPVQAGERDTQLLLNLLKKKGVITEQEAQELMKEVQTQAKQEKEERKQEIKEAAQKGDFLPGYLKGVKFGTTIFAEYRMRSEDKGGTSTNEFLLNRGYLTLSGKLNSWLGFNLTSDIFTSRDADDKGNGLEIRMKYAYADLYFWNTVTEMGLAHTPSDMYDSYVWPYRVQGKHFLDDNSIQASADFGVNIRGTFGGMMDEEFTKYAGSTYAGKWGGYQVGIYNGGGYTNAEANTNKPVGGLVYFRPAPGVDLLKGLVLSYYGMFGKSNNTFTATGKNQRLSRRAGQPGPTGLAAQMVHPFRPVLLGQRDLHLHRREQPQRLAGRGIRPHPQGGKIEGLRKILQLRSQYRYIQ